VPAPQPEAELACAYDGLTGVERSVVARDVSVFTVEAGTRLAAELKPALDACSARFRWDEGRRRLAGDYAGQRAELEARAAALPAAASAGRLQALYESLPDADRRGMAAGAEISDSDFRAIGLRLRDRFAAAGVPREAQGPAAGYLLALAHLREIEATWSRLPGR
jgi:hypothetical protein